MSTHNTDISIASRFPIESRLLRIVLGFVVICLGFGLVSPIITLNKFVLIENTFSVFSGVAQLFNEGQIFLFIVISGFSILLPIFKIIVLFILLSIRTTKTERLDKYLYWMHLYGKWAMLDVFVVAVMVVAVKLNAVASVEMRYGLYAFALAVIMTMIVTARVVSLADSAANH